MSFIDKALERAKALQQKKKERPGPPLEKESPPPRVPPFTALDSFSPPVTAEGISYTITRTVPVNLANLHRHRLLVGPQEPAVVEEYKLLRTHILQRTKGEGRNTLMITGPLPKEGKTLTAINLAISISREVNQTVLLVDADLRLPVVHRYFGISARPGLVDYLTSGYPVQELLVNPEGFPKLVILPAGKPVGHAAELINSPLMADLVQELKHYYTDRYVLFDLPPLLSYADALAFAPLVDGIIMVVEAGRTPRGDIERCIGMLKDFPLLGLVLNKVQPLPQVHYYQQNEPPAGKKKMRFPWFK